MDALLLRLDQIEQLILEQSINNKEVLNFTEATKYLEVSASHLYKLTSANIIPFYKPNGKKLYFKREELNDWLLSNRFSTKEEIESKARNFSFKKGGVLS
ncbi:MAG: helix-turn-helix domain-containing protein [Cytophagaceae bacterium]|nr:helix-turn-helix domain-containing protein [Cytophagaceae bacterium]MBK9509847.1 helix-turn-helix domain-containing protein [Cytophagaceae bacterium]MBK9934104.1 helix-turn-helix domain-containing protein [Cytophagaceae bacterium]MBL0327498.1 helix-turn-helix domain-containing protein [Cytophagaceae bacterium]